MGTPGDQKEIGKVVKTELQQAEPPEQQQHQQQQQAFSISADHPYQPLPGTSAEMGVIERLPQFGTFTSTAQPTLAHTLTKPVAYQQTLEQATIEDYYAQSKYPPTFPQSVAIRPKTFLTSSIDQPGPSGLQTPKTKPSTIPIKPKRVRKLSPEHTPSKKLHYCQACEKHFSSSEKLNKHQQSHSGTSPFKCEHCKKVFSSKFKLVRHALIHSDRKPFCCTVCDKTFHRKDHLKNHIKVHSPQKEVYTCEKQSCKKQYTSLLSYRKHLAVHAAEEGNLECQICSEHFDTREDILYHLKIHAGSRTVKNPSEKKFNCDHCDRKFFTKKDVRRHLVVHTGMRDFLCQFCPQRFGRKDHLVRHIKKSHHAQYRPPEETVTAATVKKEIPEVKTEFAETSTEFPETAAAVGGQEVYSADFGEFTFQLPPFLEQADPLTLLPSTSEPVELEDLGSRIFEEEMPEEEQPPSAPCPSLLIGEGLAAAEASHEEPPLEVVLNDPELLQRLLQSSEEKNLPLPGFSQTFQTLPPPGGPGASSQPGQGAPPPHE